MEVQVIKDIRKYVWLFLIGLFTAAVLYPALHEFGHSLFSVLFGGEIKKFSLFPLPNVICEFREISKISIGFIGFGGIFTPLFISVILQAKHFTVWYILQIIKLISILACCISLLSVFGQKYGFYVANDDIITIIELWPNGKPLCAVLTAGFMLLALHSFFKQKILEHFYCYFNIKEK